MESTSSILRVDNWTPREDTLVIETVLEAVSKGNTQLYAFDVVERATLGRRTAEATGFRWNKYLRHRDGVQDLLLEAKREGRIHKKKHGKASRVDAIVVSDANYEKVSTVTYYQVRLSNIELEKLKQLLECHDSEELQELKDEINKIV